MNQDISIQLLLLIFLNLIPIVFIGVLYKNRRSLNTDFTKKRIGSMYQTVQPITKYSLTYPVIFLFRRSVFVAMTFYLFDYPVL